MALKQEIIELMTVTRTANAVLTANRLVKADADPANVVVCTANARPLGLVDVSAVVGDPVKVIVQGIVQIEVGAAGVTQDTAVVSDAAGCVVDIGVTGDQNIVGYALHTKTDGQLASVLLFPTGKYADSTGGGIGDAVIVVGAEVPHAVHSITCNIQLNDAYGNALAVVGVVHAYLSSDALGKDIATATLTTDLAAGTDGSRAILLANTAYLLVSEADGDIDVVLIKTDGAGTWYLNLVLPSGKIVTSGAITFSA